MKAIKSNMKAIKSNMKAVKTNMKAMIYNMKAMKEDYNMSIKLYVEFVGSEEAQIKIKTVGQRFMKPVNGNLTLPCRALYLDDSVVTWSKDGLVISADGFKVRQDDRIDVVYMPGIGVDLQLTGLTRGDTGSNVRLECHAGGQPTPRVYWNRQHNQPMNWKGSTTRIEGDILELLNISREMHGEYTCNADNGVSLQPAWQSININVLYSPEVSAERSWIHAGVGEDITFICIVYSNPPAKVSWYKQTMKLLDGEKIRVKTVGDTYRFLLSSVEEKDYGEYMCKAGNMLEEDVTQIFTLTGKPAYPLIVGDREGLERYSYDLKWEVLSSYLISSHELVYWEADKVQSSTPVPPKSAHYRRVFAALSEGGYTYNMKGLQNNTFYDVIVRSQNKYGWSPYSTVFTFRTAEIDKTPLEVRIPAETSRPIYEGQAIAPEPVTSEAVRILFTSIISPVLISIISCF
ncbi:lachesin [Eurytemora carolleeae]|uniref:lachesin n=1 Tax=Eurytemora carolleeae TaxID=1294199 RepID=UPI000C77135F|nr:lachesin [Eurytemora carolleeae]|eukprot:XP_023340168.1 lachesin-like [Eurytemora affinis]